MQKLTVFAFRFFFSKSGDSHSVCAANLIYETADPREATTWRADICCSAT